MLATFNGLDVSKQRFISYGYNVQSNGHKKGNEHVIHELEN